MCPRSDSKLFTRSWGENPSDAIEGLCARLLFNLFQRTVFLFSSPNCFQRAGSSVDNESEIAESLSIAIFLVLQFLKSWTFADVLRTRKNMRKRSSKNVDPLINFTVVLCIRALRRCPVHASSSCVGSVGIQSFPVWPRYETRLPFMALRPAKNCWPRRRKLLPELDLHKPTFAAGNVKVGAAGAIKFSC